MYNKKNLLSMILKAYKKDKLSSLPSAKKLNLSSELTVFMKIK